MTTQLTSRKMGLGQLFGQLLRIPICSQTYRNLVYLVLMFPLGVCYFNILVVGFAIGVPLSIVGIGIPIVLAVFVLGVEFARLERHLVRRLLNIEISAPAAEIDGSLWTRARRLITAIQTWKAIAYLISEFVYGSFVFGVIASGVATSVSFLLAPFYYTDAPVVAYGPIPTSEFTFDILFGWDSLLVGLTTTFQLGSWQIETLFGALLFSGLGIALLWLVLVFCNAAAELWGHYARRMLTPQRYWTLPRL